MANFPTSPSIGDLFETKHDTFKWNGSAWEALGRILTHRNKSGTPYSSLSIKESGGVLDTNDASTVLLVGEQTTEGQVKAAHSSDANTVFLSGETVESGIAEFSNDGNTVFLSGESASAGLEANTADVPTSLLLTGERDASLYKMRCGLSSNMVLTEGYSLDGIEDYIEIPSSTDFDFGTGDFTVELWMKSSHSNSQSWTALVDRRGQVAAFHGWLLGLCDGDGGNAGIKGRPRFHGAGSDIQLQATTDCLDGYWHHIAISRESGTMRIFVDGVLENSATISQDLTTGANTLSVLVGASRPFGTAAEFFDGEVKDVKISKGVARYTASFTTEVTTKDSNHKLILDGTRTDSSDSSHSLTFQNGAHEVSKTGNKSWHKFGSPLGYIRTYDSISLDGDFTIEWWYLAKAAGTQHMFTIGDSQQSSGLEFYQGGDGQKLYTSGAYIWTNGGYVSVDTWYHFAVVRSSGVVKVYRDGTQIGSDWSSNTTFSGQIGVGVEWYGNQAYVNANEAYYDDFTIHKTAKYTGAFTPSTTAAAIDGLNTLFKATTDYDTSDKMNDTIGFHGNATTIEKGYHFDGTGDYISVPYNDDFDFGSGDFTVECWWNPQASQSDSYIISLNWASGGSNYAQCTLEAINYFGAGKMRIAAGTTDSSGAKWTDYNSVDLDLDKWYHIAAVRHGDTFTCYVDGVANPNPATLSGALVNSSNGLYVGKRDVGTHSNSLVDQVRVTKGVARYTGAFTSLVTTKDASHKLILDGDSSDSSDSDHSVTFHGDTYAMAKKGNRSMYFDGNGDYVSVPDSENFELADGDFTIECWIRPENIGSYNRHFFSKAHLSAQGGSHVYSYRSFSGHILDSGKAGFVWYYGESNASINGTTTLSNNTWYHYAVVRSGGTISLYIDGNLEGSTSANVTINNSTAKLHVGSAFWSTDSGGNWNSGYQGHINDLRVSKGTARYTSAFDVESVTGISDQSSNSHTVTASGNATVSTAQKKFGTHSMYFTRTVGDKVTIPTHSDFDFGSGDFTIEAWCNWSSGTGGTSREIVALGKWNQGGLEFVWRTENKFKVHINGVANIIDTGNNSFTPVVGQWYHIALTRSGTSLRLFIDGQQLGSTATTSGSISSNYGDGVMIGNEESENSPWDGYIDDVRLSDTARYTDNFHIDAGTHLTDQSSSSHSLTVTGNAVASTAQKKFGTHSMHFDGTGDYIDIPSSSDFAFGTGDFTIEFWFRYDSAGYYPYLLDGTVSGIGAAVPTIFLESPDSYKPVYWASGAQRIRSSVGTSVDTWYHLAIERNGDTTTMYLDGTSVGSFTDSISYVTCPLRIGDYSNNGGYGISGYIDDLRISDTARYTSAFNIDDVASPIDKKGTHTLTLNGDALIASSGSSEETKFGTGAMKFDGTGDYISVPSSSDFAFGTDSFTIEVWLKYSSGGDYPYVLDGRTSGTNGAFPSIYLRNDDSHKVAYYVDGGERIRSSSGLTADTWHHLAIVRSSGTTTMYLDGNSVGSFSDSFNYLACPLRVGDYSNGGYGFTGCMDEFRISTNARYAGAFTPQLAEHDLVDVNGWGSPVLGSGKRALFVNKNGFVMKSSDGTLTKLDTTTLTPGSLAAGEEPASNSKPTLYVQTGTDSNTKLLLPMDGSDSGTEFSDISSGSHNTTANGGASTKTGQKKFGTASAYFDGNGDYLSLADHDDFELGSGDFTIECWIYPQNIGSYNRHFFSKAFLSAQGGGHVYNDRSFSGHILSDGKAGFVWYYGGSNASVNGTTVLSNNTWYHYAVVKTGGTISLYINGSLEASTSDSNTINSNAAELHIGSAFWSTNSGGNWNSGYQGYIDEFRISNTGRYTGNFTVPSSGEKSGGLYYRDPSGVVTKIS